MSRYNLDNASTGADIAVGWDRPLQTYFAVVVTNDPDNPALWIGTEFQQINDAQTIIDAIRPHTQPFDESSLSKLLHDDRNHDNHFHKTSTTTATLPTVQEAAPRPYPSNHTISDVHTLAQSWDTHAANAEASKIHPFYSPGHHELIHRIQQLRDDLSYHILVPGTQRQSFDNILKDHNRQTAAIHDLTRFPSRVKQCLQDFADMNQLTHSSQTPLMELPVYEKWHRNAQQLSELGQELMNDHIAFTPYFEEVSHSWKQVAQSIIAVDTALNNNTAFSFYAHLYLEPIDRTLPPSTHETQADNQYRDVCQIWHTHLNNAHTAKIHPYEFPGADNIIAAMYAIEDNQSLAENARLCVLEQTDRHAGDLHAKDRINEYLQKADQTLEQHTSHHNTVAKLKCLNVSVEDISSHGALKVTTAHVAHTGEEILKDEWKTFDHYLARSPQVKQELRDNVDRLNTTIGRTPAPNKEEKQHHLAEHESVDHKQVARRSIKF